MAEGFAAIPTWMFREHGRVTSVAVLVFGALATRAGLRGNYPSQETLAAEARCSERRVRDALKELEELGVVERVRRTSPQGHRMPDGYRLMDRPLGKDESLPETAAGRDDAYRQNSTEPTGRNEHSLLSIEVDSSEVDICANAHSESAHSFDEWWNVYPLKKDKGRARTAYKTALKKTSHEVLVAAALAYRDDPNRVPGFTKYPASWLNAEAWENGPFPRRSGSVQGGTAVERMIARASGLSEGARRELGA